MTNVWLASTIDANTSAPPPSPKMPKPGITKISNRMQQTPAMNSSTSSQPAVPEEEAHAAVGATPISEPPQSSPRMRFYLYCRQHGLWPKEVTGRDPDAEPRPFDPWCPVRNVTRQYPPTMLLHGDADTDVPYRQSMMMAEELKRHGVEHELITIPGGPHGFDRAMDKPEISAIFDRAVQFIARKLKP